MFDILGGLAVFVFIIVGMVSPIIAFFFRKKGFKAIWKKSNLLLLGVLIFIITPILIASYYTEEKPLIDKMDKKYALIKNDLPKDETTEKILVELYKTGASTSGNRNINYVVNNYNHKDFNGKIIISAFYGGKKISEKEFELFLLSKEKGYDDYIDANKLNINRDKWKTVKIKYKIKGEFPS
ncbi:hypothetical protein ACFFHF_17310 [Robertmurraya beringensis]|uniref:Uncharacterized protein n=1 Tax=Robertmurraya beringensis TaxID=641660 RepID=A0ABV6KVM7_9BACI